MKFVTLTSANVCGASYSMPLLHESIGQIFVRLLIASVLHGVQNKWLHEVDEVSWPTMPFLQIAHSNFDAFAPSVVSVVWRFWALDATSFGFSASTSTSSVIEPFWTKSLSGLSNLDHGMNLVIEMHSLNTFRKTLVEVCSIDLVSFLDEINLAVIFASQDTPIDLNREYNSIPR